MGKHWNHSVHVSQQKTKQKLFQNTHAQQILCAKYLLEWLDRPLCAMGHGCVQTAFLKSVLQAFHFQFSKVQSLGNIVRWYVVRSLVFFPFQSRSELFSLLFPHNIACTPRHFSSSKPSPLSPSDATSSLPDSGNAKCVPDLGMNSTPLTSSPELQTNGAEKSMDKTKLQHPRQVRSLNQTLDALQQIWGSQIDLIQNLRKGVVFELGFFDWTLTVVNFVDPKKRPEPLGKVSVIIVWCNDLQQSFSWVLGNPCTRSQGLNQQSFFELKLWSRPCCCDLGSFTNQPPFDSTPVPRCEQHLLCYVKRSLVPTSEMISCKHEFLWKNVAPIAQPWTPKQAGYPSHPLMLGTPHQVLFHLV